MPRSAARSTNLKHWRRSGPTRLQRMPSGTRASPLPSESSSTPSPHSACTCRARIASPTASSTACRRQVAARRDPRHSALRRHERIHRLLVDATDGPKEPAEGHGARPSRLQPRLDAAAAEARENGPRCGDSPPLRSTTVIALRNPSMDFEKRYMGAQTASVEPATITGGGGVRRRRVRGGRALRGLEPAQPAQTGDRRRSDRLERSQTSRWRIPVDPSLTGRRHCPLGP